MDDKTPPNIPPPHTNIVEMPAKKNELAAVAEQLKRDMDLLIENQRTIAKIRRAAFEAYREQGFTEQQALELCVK